MSSGKLNEMIQATRNRIKLNSIQPSEAFGSIEMADVKEKSKQKNVVFEDPLVIRKKLSLVKSPTPSSKFKRRNSSCKDK